MVCATMTQMENKRNSAADAIDLYANSIKLPGIYKKLLACNHLLLQFLQILWEISSQ